MASSVWSVESESMDLVTPKTVRPPRVVLRPTVGPDQIADVWIEGKVENYLDTPYGKFSLLRTGQRYVMYKEVEAAK